MSLATPSLAELMRADPVVELHRPIQPEERLMLAVLEQAVTEIRRAVPAFPEQRDRAVTWLIGADVEHPFSFLAICGHFGLSPAAIRAAVLGV